MIIIKRLKYKKKESTNSIIFADFETVTVDGKQYVTCYSTVDDKNLVAFEVIKYWENRIEIHSKIVIDKFFSELFKLKNVTVFFHNLLKFDMYFMLEIVSKDTSIEIDIMSRDNTVYSVTFIKDGNKIVLKDTYLMMPMSLSQLTAIYGTVRKGDFDHDNCYSDYFNPLFVKNLVDYCVRDTQCLKEVYYKFCNQVYNTFKVDPVDSLTISSLSLKIFRTKYYDDELTPINIPNISRDTFIRSSYYGGVVELYKPRMEGGWHLDVNALYPSVMSENLYPTGPGVFMSGNEIDITKFFGFLKVKVYSPSTSEPFLVKYDHKLGLISPSGSWESTYFSEEVKYAMKFGYRFEIIKGLSYEPMQVFSSFVKDMYEYRIKSGKNSALGMTVKLLMNSLYGRFGMKLESSKTSMISEEKYIELCKTHIIDKVTIINSLYLANYKSVPNKELMYDSFEKGRIDHECLKKMEREDIKGSLSVQASVGIASAVTSYARIKMHSYKMLCPEGSLCYTDTDSLFTTKEIPSQYISDTEMGLLKLEGIVKKAIFVAPKSYFVEYVSGKVVKKSKGFKSENVSEDDYEKAINDISKNIEYINPFFIDKKKFEIIHKRKVYNFRSVVNKRIKIFDKDGLWASTKALTLYECPLDIKFLLKFL